MCNAHCAYPLITLPDRVFPALLIPIVTSAFALCELFSLAVNFNVRKNLGLVENQV
jgi:hypothetical protein